MIPGTHLRAEAARALARIALDGTSLRPELAALAPRFADPRDRALLSASLFQAARWWLRLDAALGRLIDKPLPGKARDVRALLVLALTQVDVLRMPEYAVVAAAVDAARSLGHARYAGLVNAVLRRYLRERDAIGAALDADPVTRHAHPRWLIERLRADWPEAFETILAANNREAALTLRVNRRRIARADLLERFAAAGIAAHAPASLPDALVLADGGDVTRLPGYAEGAFSVQDGAAQRVVDLLDLRDGQRVLDACAAPGGKAAHALERADVDLLALDHDAARLARVTTNLQRLGLAAEVRAGDALQAAWWDGRAFDRILLDAPCSATGIIRRQPDIKLHRRAADLVALAEAQRGMLTNLWPMLRPGGRLVYVTCSLLRAENEGVVDAFVAAHGDARVVPIDADYGLAAGAGRQNLPGQGEMDGFYYAAVEKLA